MSKVAVANKLAVADVFGEAATQVVASADALRNASIIVEKLAQLEAEAGSLQKALTEKNSEINALRTVRVPEALAAVNLLNFTLAEGLYAGVGVEIKDFVSGSLAKATDDDPQRRIRALAALSDVEGGIDLVKSQIIVTFDKRQHNVALALLATLKEKNLDAEMEEGVHPQTLAAFARQCLKGGVAIDTDTIGLFVGRAAKLKWPKER